MRTYLSLGSNLGDRQHNIEQALDALGALPNSVLSARSSFFLTAPQGIVQQPAFINIVCRLETSLTPLTLLFHTQKIEQTIGLMMKKRWHARHIDIDILTVGDTRLAFESLTLPHPRMLQRRFVLEPMAEIAPHYRLANSNTVEQQLALLGHSQAVVRCL